jgi:hypothetical protein
MKRGAGPAVFAFAFMVPPAPDYIPLTPRTEI